MGRPKHPGHRIVYGLDGGTQRAIRVDASGDLLIAAIQNQQVDSVTGGLIILNLEDYQILSGRTFASSRKSQGLTVASSREYLLQTGSKYSHLKVNMVSDQKGEAYMFEGTTFSAAGSALPINALNRVSSDSPTVTVTHTPTLTDDGSKMVAAWTGLDGRVLLDAVEWILDKNEDYLIRFTNRGSGPASLSIMIRWYEEDNAVW